MLRYPARIKKTEGAYIVNFIDFESINTWGDTLDQALKNAEDALNGCLESDFERGFQIPDPSDIKGRNIHFIPLKPNIAISLILRKLRGRRTQQEIASMLKISFQVYQRLENPRKANPTLKTLEKVASTYGKHISLDFV